MGFFIWLWYVTKSKGINVTLNGTMFLLILNIKSIKIKVVVPKSFASCINRFWNLPKVDRYYGTFSDFNFPNSAWYDGFLIVANLTASRQIQITWRVTILWNHKKKNSIFFINLIFFELFLVQILFSVKNNNNCIGFIVGCGIGLIIACTQLTSNKYFRLSFKDRAL